MSQSSQRPAQGYMKSSRSSLLHTVLLPQVLHMIMVPYVMS